MKSFHYFVNSFFSYKKRMKTMCNFCNLNYFGASLSLFHNPHNLVIQSSLLLVKITQMSNLQVLRKSLKNCIFTFCPLNKLRALSFCHTMKLTAYLLLSLPVKNEKHKCASLQTDVQYFFSFKHPTHIPES